MGFATSAPTMPANDSVDDFLTDILQEFEGHVYQQESYGSYAPPYPSLTNDVLPMFTDRWASGRDQHTREFFHKLEPALQLTSLLLTETYPLLWFSRLTFGKLHSSSSGSYLVPTPYCVSPEAISEVKANLREFGKVITFMFCPRDWNMSEYWGTTYADESDEPRIREFFRNEDWPPVRSLELEGHARPVIAMNACFQEYFRKPALSVTEHYRALFTFAVTLCHEVAHAYEYWLCGCESLEPRWCQCERQAELGFSWESAIIGHVLNPMQDPMNDRTRFRGLFSIRLEEYATEDDRDALLHELKGGTCAQFTTRDVAGYHRDWPLLHPRELRGADWYVSLDATAILAGIYAVPTQWIVDWFQKDVWTRRKMEWAQLQDYRPPSLDNAFMIIYERTAHGAQIERPLNPFFDVDAEILQERAEKKMKEEHAARRDQGFGYSW